MIPISGIEYQQELERLPFFNKKTAAILTGKSGGNLDKQLSRLERKGYLIRLKKGLYVSTSFVEKLPDRQLYLEYLGGVLRFPAYISLEYALSEYGLIPEGVASVTSVTLKSSRVLETPLGTFIYRSLKELLFGGFTSKDFLDKKINWATPAKALFDFLYLRKLTDLPRELTEDLRINWANFTAADRSEFSQWVERSGSKKMARILEIIGKHDDH